MTSSLSITSLEAKKLVRGKYSMWYEGQYIYCCDGLTTYKFDINGSSVVPYDPTVDKNLLPYEENKAITYINQTVAEALYNILSQVIVNQKGIDEIKMELPALEYDPTINTNLLPYYDSTTSTVIDKEQTMYDAIKSTIEFALTHSGGGSTYDPTVDLALLPFYSYDASTIQYKIQTISNALYDLNVLCLNMGSDLKPYFKFDDNFIEFLKAFVYDNKYISGIAGKDYVYVAGDSTTEQENVHLMTFEYYEAHKAELKGDPGPQGPQGNPGKDGKDGKDGLDGENGEDGGSFFWDLFNTGLTAADIAGTVSALGTLQSQVATLSGTVAAMASSDVADAINQATDIFDMAEDQLKDDALSKVVKDVRHFKSEQTAVNRSVNQQLIDIRTQATLDRNKIDKNYTDITNLQAKEADDIDEVWGQFVQQTDKINYNKNLADQTFTEIKTQLSAQSDQMAKQTEWISTNSLKIDTLGNQVSEITSKIALTPERSSTGVNTSNLFDRVVEQMEGKVEDDPELAADLEYVRQLEEELGILDTDIEEALSDLDTQNRAIKAMNVEVKERSILGDFTGFVNSFTGLMSAISNIGNDASQFLRFVDKTTGGLSKRTTILGNFIPENLFGVGAKTLYPLLNAIKLDSNCNLMCKNKKLVYEADFNKKIEELEGKDAYQPAGKIFNTGYVNDCWQFAIIYHKNMFTGMGSWRYGWSTDGKTFNSKYIYKSWFGMASNSDIIFAVGEYRRGWSLDGTSYTATGCEWYMIGAAFGNSMFVGLSNDGKTIKSYDGKTVENGGTLTTGTWTGITFGNGKFVAVGTNLTSSSVDDQTWTDGTIPEGTWTAITYGNGKFVAVSSDGKTCHSTDDQGSNFELGSIPSGDYRAITYGNGMFVAVGVNVVAWSIDGENFSPGIIPNATYKAIAFGNDMFVATGDNSAIAYSESTLGNVKFGSGLSISTDGTLSAKISCEEITDLEVLDNTYASKTELEDKQDKLTAGTGITIQNNTISVNAAPNFSGYNQYSTNIMQSGGYYIEYGDTYAWWGFPNVDNTYNHVRTTTGTYIIKYCSNDSEYNYVNADYVLDQKTQEKLYNDVILEYKLFKLDLEAMYNDNLTIGVGQASSSDVSDEFYIQSDATITKLEGNRNLSSLLTIGGLLDYLYPVGSIYTSMNNTNPNLLFGGTWEQIIDRFMYCTSGASAETGGSKNISVDQMPQHSHMFTGNEISGRVIVRPLSDGGSILEPCYYDAYGALQVKESQHTAGKGAQVAGWSDGNKPSKDIVFRATPSGLISNTGFGNDYLPPYITIFAWYRTA